MAPAPTLTIAQLFKKPGRLEASAASGGTSGGAARLEEPEQMPPVPPDRALEPRLPATSPCPVFGEFAAEPPCPGPGAASRGPSGPSAKMLFMSEPGSSALIDTAAQHGLIGEETLHKHDQTLQRELQLRVQVTNEDGGVVRVVCGAEQITKIAYISIGLGSKAGVLKVQVVPGNIPCLLPAYLLTKLGAVIDMCNLLAVCTEANTFQFMKRRLSGHVEVNICEFGKRWCVSETYTFLKSEVWDQGPLPTPLSDLRVTVVNGSGQALPMPSSMASLCSAIVVSFYNQASNMLEQVLSQPRHRGPRRLAAQREALEQRALRLQQQEAVLLAEAGSQPFRPVNRLAAVDDGSELRPRAEHVGRSKYLTPVLKQTCERSQRVELHHDLPTTRLQDPACQEGRESRDSRQEEEGPKDTEATAFDDDELKGAYASPPTGAEHLDISAPDSPAYPNSEREPGSDGEAMERDLWQEVEPPAMFQRCTMCPSGGLNLICACRGSSGGVSGK